MFLGNVLNISHNIYRKKTLALPWESFYGDNRLASSEISVETPLGNLC